MTKFFLLLPVALFFSAFSLHAQVNTIQVTVTDTIEVMANRIPFLLSFSDSTDAGSYDDEGNYIPPRANFEEESALLASILERNKITWKNPGEQMSLFNNLGGMGNNNSKSFDMLIEFKSKDQMDRIMPEIRSIPFISITEIGPQADKNTVDLTPLYDKLLKKARAKAEILAKLSGKKVGAVYQIGSPFDSFSPEKYMESMSGGGFMGGLMSMMSGMFSEKRPDYKVTISENLTVSFYME